MPVRLDDDKLVTLTVTLGYEIDVPLDEVDYFLEGDPADRDRSVWSYIEARHPGRHTERKDIQGYIEHVRYMSLDVEK